MTIPDQIAERLKALPDDRQYEVLLFIEALTRSPNSPEAGRSPCGLWASFGIDISEAEIDSARAALWGGFARDTEL